MSIVSDERVEELLEALRPFAALGRGRIKETDPENQRKPFWDCPDDLVLYHDNMGNAITVGNVRNAVRVVEQRVREP